MARRDKDNRAKFWVDRDLGGVGLLKADFGTWSFAPHVHSELVIAVTEEGAGRCVTRGVSDIGTSRTTMVFNPGEPHAGGVAGSDGWHYRGLYIGEGRLGQIGGSLGNRRAATPYFRNSVVNDPDLADALLSAHLALEDHDMRLVRESLFLVAVVNLLERHGAPPRSIAEVGQERRPVLRALEYMHDHYAADLTVDELAACASLSPFHFVRSFRKVTGLPPHAYLTQLRLDRARLLLAGGEAPTNAAVAVGFYDQSHLIKHFKRAYGITPGQYAAALA